jgi:hypothetical protein
VCLLEGCLLEKLIVSDDNRRKMMENESVMNILQKKTPVNGVLKC